MQAGPSSLCPLFDFGIDVDPAQPFDAVALGVPARWAVYLLADEQDRPVQLLSVRNLRYSLRRRLGGEATVGAKVEPVPASKRVDYRALVRRVHWRRVDGPLEADLCYLDAARHLFPRTYRGMVGYRPAWFVHLDDAAAFPRYTRTTDLSPRPGTLLGPVEDKHAAQRLIQLLEDAFDLCRYHNVLVQAPHGQACAYKEMGKCPAPCDGSVSMAQYRRLIEWSRRVLVDPADAVREQDRRMRQAAGELRFEIAGRIKAHVEQLSLLGQGPFRRVAAVADFQFLAVQPGPRPGSAKVFLVLPGRVVPLLCVADAAAVKPAELMRAALIAAAEAGGSTGLEIDPAGAERVGVVAHHLFARKFVGAILPLATLDERAIARAIRDLQKLPPARELDDDEGVEKEWQEAEHPTP